MCLKKDTVSMTVFSALSFGYRRKQGLASLKAGRLFRWSSLNQNTETVNKWLIVPKSLCIAMGRMSGRAGKQAAFHFNFTKTRSSGGNLGL